MTSMQVARKPSEWPGLQIGVANIMTQARTPLIDVDRLIDTRPEVLDRLFIHAMGALEGPNGWIHDAVFQGHRIRCFTNSHHLGDFWRENTWSVAEWQRVTGAVVPSAPALNLYAVTEVDREGPSAALSKSRSQVFLFNTSRYDDLRSLALESLGALRASAVSARGKGALLLGAPDRIPLAWALMEDPRARFLADDALFLHGHQGRALAFPAERRLCTAPSRAALFPEHAYAFLSARLENVPEETPASQERLDSLTSGALASRNPEAIRFFRTLTPSGLRTLLARLIASDASRALVSPEAAFGAKRVFMNPLEPLPIDAVFWVHREDTDATILQTLTPENFKALSGLELPALANVPRYSLNAVFDMDPANRTMRDRACAGVRLIERTLERPAERLTISTYRNG